VADLILFYPEGHAAHAEPGHPERPDRVEAMRRALERSGAWEAGRLVAPLSLPESVLLAVHSPAYLARLRTVCAGGGRLDADTYTTPASWNLALQAAGGAAAVAAAVWLDGPAGGRGLALTRPPGHHAGRGRGMGFCLLNNVALAAQMLLETEGARRLAIVDLDLHHGNGTQEIFWERPEVFFISTHQSPLYPGTGWLDETGGGAGQGTTANFPLPPGTGDTGFHAMLNQAILPLLERFAPEMVLVSFGFDPHWRDPLGHLRLSAGGFGRLISRLAEFAGQNCQGRLALFLEGGYDLEAADACAGAIGAALLDRPWNDPLGSDPHGEGRSWLGILDRAKMIWGL
jgi:acetoin utilization deacetylase AcuC-like enzyme